MTRAIRRPAWPSKLILEDKVDLVLGPFGSPNVTVASTVTEKLGYPMLVYAVSEEISGS